MFHLPDRFILGSFGISACCPFIADFDILYSPLFHAHAIFYRLSSSKEQKFVWGWLPSLWLGIMPNVFNNQLYDFRQVTCPTCPANVSLSFYKIRLEVDWPLLINANDSFEYYVLNTYYVIDTVLSVWKVKKIMAPLLAIFKYGDRDLYLYIYLPICYLS